MIDINCLDDALVICTTAFKNHLLKKASENGIFLNSKFMSLEEFMKNYFFDYDFKALKYLVDNHQMKIDVAKTYLKNLHFVEEKDYNNEKLDQLVNYRKELSDNNLLIENPHFSKYIQNWDKIIVLGYGKLDKFYQNVFDRIKAEIIEFDFIDKDFNYLEFDTMEKEVQYLYNSISKLLENNVDINDIYVMNADSSYESYFNRYNDYFHFKIEEKNESSFASLTIVKQFIAVLKKKEREALEEFLTENSASKHINRIISIINKYVQTEDYIDLIIDELKKTKIKSETYTNIVRRVNLFEPFEDRSHVFLVGFNDSCPALSVDTDYITDDIKYLVGLSDAEEKNRIKKENLLNYLSNINNLYLSFCKNSLRESFNQSSILDKMTINNKLNNFDSYLYSDKLNKYRFAQKLDQFSKYHLKDKNLEKLYATYGKNNYREYDHSYKKIEKQLDDSLNLSYSQINNYYLCPFKYFVERKLKINDQTSQFYIQLGNIFHDVLKEVFEKNIDDMTMINEVIDKKIKEVISKQQYNESEKYFTRSLKQELLKDIEIIRQQHGHIGFKNYEYEIKKEVQIDEKINFNGVIDKLIHQKIDDDRFIAVVDYKTGSEVFREDFVEDGLSLQLPSYLYLASKIFDKENKKYAGFYIQHLINTDYKYEKNKNIRQKKFDSMKLKGKSNGDEGFYILESFDQSFRDSELIDIIISNEDKIRYKKGIDNKGVEELIELTEEKIVEAGNLILNREFPITPYEYSESCKYCTYSDICYRVNSDFKKIKEMENDDE
ncbi:MAG: PD-(D/E)XK nuclease family protein [Bacillota bacterium]|nr:PD-(D/E)XK nuclease family protein [Bacillota bacterium]NLL25812.1 PD-(D/E)XK nuclease family protein [Erysipelotrichia bacterium]